MILTFLRSVYDIFSMAKLGELNGDMEDKEMS